MGRIINIKPNEIKPSQDFVKEDTIRYILGCIINHEEDKLPPTPIVRNNPDGCDYIAIDGHNLLVIYDLLERNCEVYLADSAKDKLEELPKSSPDAILKRNQDLKEKYDLVIIEVARLQKDNISSLKDLRAKYAYLNDLNSAMKYFNLYSEMSILQP